MKKNKKFNLRKSAKFRIKNDRRMPLTANLGEKRPFGLFFGLILPLNGILM
jgi:hypothetical protein